MADLPEPLQEFFHGAPCGLLLAARDGKLLAVNDTFLTWTGYERQALTSGRHFDELLTVPCRIYHETQYAPLLHLQGYANEIALDFRKADSTILPALVNAVAKPAADGSVALVRYAVFSAVQRRSYERQLLLERRISEQAVRAKADYLAMFAHEIRNPLSAVLLELDVLERTQTQAPDDGVIPELRESLDRVLRLLNNMLEISKLEAGKTGLQRAELEIADVMQAVVHTLRPLAVARGLRLSWHVDEALCRPLIGDPVKLEQALTNLVGNAIKFTESGSVRVDAQRVAQQPDRVRARFSVADTGIGIPSECRARIFDDYEQADASIAGRFGGTGLGLAITRKLVELQGGQLAVESEEGRGSTFSFEVTFDAA